MGVCIMLPKQLKAPSATYRGLERPPTALPTCSPRYPPGSTLLECRLEGNQPVAHVVQVPSGTQDRNTATQKTYLLVETKQPQFGPLYRIVSHPKDRSRSNQEDSQLQSTICLEPCKYGDGPTATVAMIPIDSSSNLSNMATSSETTKGGCNPEEPLSKIVYASMTEETPNRGIVCMEDGSSLPVTIIDCKATKKQASAKVTKCTRSDANSNNSLKKTFEISISTENNSPKSVDFVCPEEQSGPCQHSVLETIEDDCGPKTKNISFLPEDNNFCTYIESKLYKDGPSSKMQNEPMNDTLEKSCPRKQDNQDFKKSSLYPPKDCMIACIEAIKPKQTQPADYPAPITEKRNGLDPSDMVTPSPFRKIPKRAVCPPRCCKPTDKPKSCHMSVEPKPVPDSVPQSKPKSPKKFKYILIPYSALENMLGEKSKCETKERSSNSTKPKTELKENACKRKGDKNISDDFVPTVKSEELLTRYREYMPPYLLSTYEACRSKRNGLQDECTLYVPRIVLELKKKEMMGDNENGRYDGTDDT